VLRGFEANGADKPVEVVNDALIEAIELGSALMAEPGISCDRAEKARGKRRVDSFEKLQEDKADGVSLRQELVTSRARKLGDEAFGPEL
jgi:hypothetical protein